MLNIIKLKLKNKYKTIGVNAKNRIIYYKEFSTDVRNYKNSIYVYNKNILILIHQVYKISKKYNKLFRKNVFKKKLLLNKKKGLKYIKEQIRQKNVILKALALKYDYNTQQKMFYDKIIKNYQNRYYKRFIRKSLRRVLLFIYFK